MNERLFLAINSVIIMSVLIVIRIMLLKCSKQDIYMGVRIPPEERKSEEIKKIEKKFINSNIYICIPIMIILSFVVFKIESEYVAPVCIFSFLIINFYLYYIYNKKVKQLKERKKWIKGSKQIVTIDTKYSKEKNKKVLPSSLWFLIPVTILIINIILNYIYYSDLPQKVATQWNFNGEIISYEQKSIKLIFIMPKIELVMIVITFIVFKSIGWAKQQISNVNSKESIRNNITFRRVWAIYTICTCIVMTLIFTLGDFQIMNIINISPRLSVVFIMIIMMLILTTAIIISLKIGQGGSRLNASINIKNNNYAERDDDKFWRIANTIYYNPKDPSIFIEKRFGIGWTINVGNKIGMGIYIGILLIVIISLAIKFI